jgi:hypothetical protein
MMISWFKTHLPGLIIRFGLVILVLTGCNPDPAAGLTPTLPRQVEVDPIFREFYNRLGGLDVMGEALIPAEEQDGSYYQYTEAALMVYNPEASSVSQYGLAPLGADIFPLKTEGIFPAQDSPMVVDGYVVYDDFTELYTLLDTTRYAGRPISQPIVDVAGGRVLQYFENVGFYKYLTGPDESVHLLAYGGFYCRSFCSYLTNQANSPQIEDPVEEPFLTEVMKLGLDLTGRPVTPVYLTPEGGFEQVYENVVIYASADDLHSFILKPLPALTGYPPTTLVQEQKTEGLVFIPIGQNLGHNVASIFEDYVSNHGGEIYSGLPTTEIFPIGSLYRQCFTNYCLDYDPSASEETRIHPTPLGKVYIQFYNTDLASSGVFVLSEDTVEMTIWQQNATVTDQEQQVIGINIMKRVDQTPLYGLTAEVTIHLPDGSQRVYKTPETDSQGKAEVTLDPIHAVNGTIIPFQVCLNNPFGLSICKDDSFVIWTTS